MYTNNGSMKPMDGLPVIAVEPGMEVYEGMAG